MGTRHLILVYYKGTYFIAQYGQWDGFPDGQGIVVLKFVRDQANLVKLKTSLDTPGRLYEPTHAQLEEWIPQLNDQMNEFYRRPFDPNNPMASIERPEPLYPGLSRETGAKILQVVANATEPVPIVKEVAFIADTLFCEWAYVVDLDSATLEVYSGRRDGYQQQRFGEAEGVSAGQGPSLLKSWELCELPEEADFLAAFVSRDEESDSEHA